MIAFGPPGTACQFVPSHLARHMACTPPALVKFPPTYREPSGPKTRALTSVVRELAPTRPLRPPPTEFQLVPSQRAMDSNCVPPELLKTPPAYTSPFGATARARTLPL